MGLFSSVLHVRDARREEVLPALDAILDDAGFVRSETLSVPAEGPLTLPDHEASVSAGPFYLVSSLHGRWLTIIEAHFALETAPNLAELGDELSGALSHDTLAMFVHDDDLFFYNLARDGEALDGYNSCPQYFEEGRLTDKQIKEQQHNPEPFQALLPAGHTLDEVRALLNRGWWNAYHAGKLDEDGVANSEDGFAFESERMTAFGTLLQLHGAEGEYPYADWAESKLIRWPEFVALRYREQD